MRVTYARAAAAVVLAAAGAGFGVWLDQGGVPGAHLGGWAFAGFAVAGTALAFAAYGMPGGAARKSAAPALALAFVGLLAGPALVTMASLGAWVLAGAECESTSWHEARWRDPTLPSTLASLEGVPDRVAVERGGNGSWSAAIPLHGLGTPWLTVDVGGNATLEMQPAPSEAALRDEARIVLDRLGASLPATARLSASTGIC